MSGKAPSSRTVSGAAGDDAYRIEPGVEEVNQLAIQLRDPVRPGKAEIARTGVQHLDDVLGFEQLALVAFQAEAGAIRTGAERYPGGRHPRAGANTPACMLPLGQGEGDGFSIRGHSKRPRAAARRRRLETKTPALGPAFRSIGWECEASAAPCLQA